MTKSSVETELTPARLIGNLDGGVAPLCGQDRLDALVKPEKWNLPGSRFHGLNLNSLGK